MCSISLETALDRCLSYVHPVGMEMVEPEYAYKRVSARDIYADTDIPAFSRSAVDGFTIHETDINNLIMGKETALEINGILSAGDLQNKTFTVGQTIKIMTGSMLPDGTAAVVKIEDVEEQKNKVFIKTPVIPGDNIQNCGSHVKKGALLASSGDLLDILTLEKIASCGIDSVQVFKTPQVYVISTGRELILPGNKLHKGQIYASNNIMYFNQISASGCKPLGTNKPIADRVEAITEQLYAGMKQSHFIIISGGTEHGQFDLVREAFHKIEADIIFTGLDIRPGHNTSAAIKNGVIMLNLPGSPGAGNIIFEVLAKPVLRRIKGITDFHNKWFDIVLINPDQIKSSSRMMVKGCAEMRNGQLTARVINKYKKPCGLFNLIIDIDSLDKKLFKAFIAD